jgi:S1-C subfamily serine protease
MIRATRLTALILLAFVAAARAGGVSPEVAQKLYDRVTPSLVAVKYTWENELGRQELTGAGIVVSDDGLVMTSLSLFDPRVVLIPDEQMKEFKIIIPSQEADAQEIEAGFEGRDERTNMAFVRPKESAKQMWKPLKFEEIAVHVGDPVLSVGLLPETAGYKSYFMESFVSSTLRGEMPMVLVGGGGVCAVGSPVFNADGKAIGIVGTQGGQSIFLQQQRSSNALPAVQNPPKMFTPARDFQQSLEDPPTASKPVPLPWIGVPKMTGLNKDVAEEFGLANQPAVEINAIIPGAPAEHAGLKQADIVVKMNGEPLERGDQPEELPDILRRKLLRMKPGNEVTLSVLRKKGEALQDIKIKLEEQPKRPYLAKRFFAEDLGFAVREMMFVDSYARRLPRDAKGVIVALMRRQSAAQSAKLEQDDLITQINGQPVTSLEQFKEAYQAARKEKPKEAVVLVVHRESQDDTVRIEPPQ